LEQKDDETHKLQHGTFIIAENKQTNPRIGFRQNMSSAVNM